MYFIDIIKYMQSVFDCFSYFGSGGEDNLLLLRLTELAPHVTRFFIVEGSHSFQQTYMGGYKLPSLLKNDERFSPFTDKIEFVPFEWYPHTNEAHQKNYLQVAYEKYMRTNNISATNCVIHFSDLDEVPHASIFSHITSTCGADKFYTLSGLFYVYHMNGVRYDKSNKPALWHGGVIGRADCIPSGGLVNWRDSRGRGGKYIIVPYSTSHFSYMGTTRQIMKKFREWGHACETHVRQFVSGGFMGLEEHVRAGHYYAGGGNRVIYKPLSYFAKHSTFVPKTLFSMVANGTFEIFTDS